MSFGGRFFCGAKTADFGFPMAHSRDGERIGCASGRQLVQACRGVLVDYRLHFFNRLP